MKRKGLLAVVIGLVMVGTSVFAAQPGLEVEQPWFWSMLIPFPLPTQVGATYLGMISTGDSTDESALALCAVVEVGKFYQPNRTLSLHLRPGMYYDGIGAQGFFMHRWYLRPFRQADMTSYDRSAITLGVGLGGYMENYSEAEGYADKYAFGPALNFSWGYEVGTTWETAIRAKFEFDVTVGFLERDEGGGDIINDHATGIGVTIGFWAPADWSWLFPGD